MEENIKINTSEFKLNHHDHGGCNTTFHHVDLLSNNVLLISFT